jgi:prepilin-type N-terminal cleavage/methylation domain-containing protein
MARRSAFTLSELLVAVAVIAILSLLLIRAVHRVHSAVAQAPSRGHVAQTVRAGQAAPGHAVTERRLP